MNFQGLKFSVIIIKLQDAKLINTYIPKVDKVGNSYWSCYFGILEVFLYVMVHHNFIIDYWSTTKNTEPINILWKVGGYLPNICPNFTIYKFQFIEVVYFMTFVFDNMFSYDCICKRNHYRWNKNVKWWGRKKRKRKTHWKAHGPFTGISKCKV